MSFIRLDGAQYLTTFRIPTCMHQLGRVQKELELKPHCSLHFRILDTVGHLLIGRRLADLEQVG